MCSILELTFIQSLTILFFQSSGYSFRVSTLCFDSVIFCVMIFEKLQTSVHDAVICTNARFLPVLPKTCLAGAVHSALGCARDFGKGFRKSMSSSSISPWISLCKASSLNSFSNACIWTNSEFIFSLDFKTSSHAPMKEVCIKTYANGEWRNVYHILFEAPRSKDAALRSLNQGLNNTKLLLDILTTWEKMSPKQLNRWILRFIGNICVRHQLIPLKYFYLRIRYFRRKVQTRSFTVAGLFPRMLRIKSIAAANSKPSLPPLPCHEDFFCQVKILGRYTKKINLQIGKRNFGEEGFKPLLFWGPYRNMLTGAGKLKAKACQAADIFIDHIKAVNQGNNINPFSSQDQSNVRLQQQFLKLELWNRLIGITAHLLHLFSEFLRQISDGDAFFPETGSMGFISSFSIFLGDNPRNLWSQEHVQKWALERQDVYFLQALVPKSPVDVRVSQSGRSLAWRQPRPRQAYTWWW